MAHGLDFKKELKRSEEFYNLQEDDLQETMLQAIEKWLIVTDTYVPENIYPMKKHHNESELHTLNNFQELHTNSVINYMKRLCRKESM